VIVGAKGDHRQRTAQMRADDLHRGIPLQVSRGDQLHRGDGVLEGRAGHPGDVMLADQWRARAVARRVQIQDGAPPIEFGEHGLEIRFGDRTIPDAGVHGEADHAQFIHRTPHFGDRCVDVRHWCGGECAEPVRVGGDQRGVLVVDVAGGRHRTLFVGGVRQLRRGRQHLQVDARAIHQPQPRVEFGAGAAADATLGGGIGFPEIDEHVEVGVCPVVRMYVDPHIRQRYSVERHAEPCSVDSLREPSRTSLG